MKAECLMKTESYFLREKQEGDLKGIIPEWVDIIDLRYDLSTGEVRNIQIRRDTKDKKSEEAYKRKHKEYHKRMEERKDRKEGLEILHEEMEFNKTYYDIIEDPSQIKQILELIEENKGVPLESRF